MMVCKTQDSLMWQVARHSVNQPTQPHITLTGSAPHTAGARVTILAGARPPIVEGLLQMPRAQLLASCFVRMSEVDREHPEGFMKKQDENKSSKTQLSQRAKRAAVWGTGVGFSCCDSVISSQGIALGGI